MGFDPSSVAEAGTGPDAKKAVTKILGNTNGWSALPSPPMACKSKLQLKCLQNISNSPLTADDKNLLGLTTLPTEPILKSLTKGCARLIASGRLAKQDGKAEFALLMQAITVAQPALGKQISQGASKAGGASSKSPASQLIWVNPTGGGIRQIDMWGSGGFGVSRSSGSRQHAGVDYIATSNQPVLAVVDGAIDRLGFPYANDLSYRYVAIRTVKGHLVREMYVDPAANIRPGVTVKAGDVIGTYQSLQKRFPGITEHVHLDIEIGGNFVDPTTLIP